MMETTDWIAISICVYLGIALMVGWYAFVMRRASVFEPIGQYLFFVTLFTLPLPLRTCFTLEIEGNITPHLLTILPYLPDSVLLTALSLPLFAFGYYGSWARHVAQHLPLPIAPRQDRSRLAFVLLAIFCFFLFTLLAAESGGLLNFLLLGYGSSEEMFGRGYLAIAFPWLFVASLLLLYRYALFRTRINLLFFVLALTVILSIQILTGNRGMLLYISLVTLIFIHYGIRRIRWKFLVPFGVAAFFLLNLVGLMRSSNYESIGEFIEKSRSSAEQVTGDDAHGLFYTLTIGEFVVPFETLPQMIRTVGISDPPWLGWTYLLAPVYMVPSVIFPERPLPLGNWYMQQFYGDEYSLNEGRQFFFLAEAYLNLMLVGVVLLALFWGWLWGVLHQWMKRSNGNPAVVFVYALSVGFMYRCIAGDFVTLLVGIPQQSLVAALIGLAIAGVSWRAKCLPKRLAA